MQNTCKTYNILAKHFPIIRTSVLSVSLKRKYNFYHQNTLLDAFRTNSRNIIGRNPSMVIPLLANQDLTPMLLVPTSIRRQFTNLYNPEIPKIKALTQK